jgi:hypothetical protein
MIRMLSNKWITLAALSVGITVAIGSLAQQGERPRRPSAHAGTGGGPSYPTGKAPWDKQWIEFGAMPGGKIGVIAHQDGLPPLQLIIDGVVGDKIQARRLAHTENGLPIQQQLQGEGIRIRMTEKKTDLTVSFEPIPVPNVVPPREPLNP